jgi:hypothetical protein
MNAFPDGPAEREAFIQEWADAQAADFALIYGEDTDFNDEMTLCDGCGRDAELINDLCPACNALIDAEYGVQS